MAKVLLPALDKLRLREITVERVDRSPGHSLDSIYLSQARRVKSVVALMFDLAVRHDAVPKNGA